MEPKDQKPEKKEKKTRKKATYLLLREGLDESFTITKQFDRLLAPRELKTLDLDDGVYCVVRVFSNVEVNTETVKTQVIKER